MRIGFRVFLPSSGYSIRILHVWQDEHQNAIILYKLKSPSPFSMAPAAEQEISTSEQLNIVPDRLITRYIIGVTETVADYFRASQLKLINAIEEIPEHERLTCVFSHPFTEEMEALEELITNAKEEAEYSLMEDYPTKVERQDFMALALNESCISNILSQKKLEKADIKRMGFSSIDMKMINFLFKYSEKINESQQISDSVRSEALEHYHINDSATLNQLKELHELYKKYREELLEENIAEIANGQGEEVKVFAPVPASCEERLATVPVQRNQSYGRFFAAAAVGVGAVAVSALLYQNI